MARRRFEEWVGDLLRDESPAGGLSLDVGCGNGRTGRFYNNRVVGIDIDRQVRPPVLGTADVLPFGERTFDFASSFQSYLFVEHVHGAFAELNRVLKDGGIAIVSINKLYYLQRERRTHEGTVHLLSCADWIGAFERQGFVTLPVRVPRRYTGPSAFLLNWISRTFGPYNIYKVKKVWHVGAGASLS